MNLVSDTAQPSFSPSANLTDSLKEQSHYKPSVNRTEVLNLAGCIHNLGYLNGVALQPSPVLGPEIALATLVRFQGPKQARTAGQLPLNTPRYGYSCLKPTSHRAI